MRDDQSDFEVTGRSFRAHSVGNALATDRPMSNDRPVDIVGQRCVHHLGVVFCPIDDELANYGDSWCIATVGGKNGLHTLIDLR